LGSPRPIIIDNCASAIDVAIAAITFVRQSRQEWTAQEKTEESEMLTKSLRVLALAAGVLAPIHPQAVSAMDAKVVGDQLILSGPVISGDLDKIRDALAASPAISTVILRNSPGGDIATGYRTGELFREKGLRTAVSGYCYSSCSRMFLGGQVRIFTDDMPLERTNSWLSRPL
jgi:hypothetical protein